MKKYIKSSDTCPEFNLSRIVSVAVVDDITTYYPRNYEVFGATDYSTFTTDQLLQLPKKELESIHDIHILRKLPKASLTVMQQRDVTQANQENFQSTIKDVKSALSKLRNCSSIYIIPSKKNNSFRQKLWDLGTKLTDEDVRNIIDQLSIRDYSYSTYSYLDWDWNSLLMVFQYSGEYTFYSRDKSHSPIKLDSLDIYIKVDVDNETGQGYAALSFHEPEFKLNHPYIDYPIDKENT